MVEVRVKKRRSLGRERHVWGVDRRGMRVSGIKIFSICLEQGWLLGQSQMSGIYLLK